MDHDISHQDIAPPSLAVLYLRHGFTSALIDIQASVPAGTTDAMMQNFPVLQKHAERVLAALSVRTGKNYSLSNVTVDLINVEVQDGREE